MARPLGDRSIEKETAMTQDLDPGTGGVQPAEGRDDLDIPGADVSGPPSEHPDAPVPGIQPTRDIGDQPDSREHQRRDELADRVGVGMPGTPASNEPDVLPDVDVPDGQM
jgi:hypothetical protein